VVPCDMQMPGSTAWSCSRDLATCRIRRALLRAHLRGAGR
jgi:hypothetical protein